MVDAAGARTGVQILADDGSDPVTVYRGNLRALYSAIESSCTLYGQGLLSARPIAGIVGRFYKPTDSGYEGTLYWDTGSVWQSIAPASTVDAAPGVGSLRTLGSGVNQAAPGDSTAAGIAYAASAELRAWCVPGGDVTGLVTSTVSVAAGSSVDVVTGPVSGRRVVKSLMFGASVSGTVVTVIHAGVTLASFVLNAGNIVSVDVLFPIAVGEVVNVTAVNGPVSVTTVYGDRSDSQVKRLGVISTSSTSQVDLIPIDSVSRNVTSLWVANPSESSTGYATVYLNGVAMFTAVPIASRSVIPFDVSFGLTASQHVSVSCDGVTSLTFYASGR